MTEFRVGDLVRKKNSDLVFTLDDINPNPRYKENNEYWGAGSSSGSYGNVEVDDPSEIELVMNADEAAKRTVPSVDDIAKFLSSSVHSAWGKDGFIVSESEPQGNEVEVVATADNGLEFVFRIAVVSVQETSW
jgi:hypothetical protein